MRLSVRKVHVKIEGIVIPSGRNPSRSSAGLQGSGIRSASCPRVVLLVLNGKRGITRNALAFVGHRIPVGAIHTVPTAFRVHVRAYEARDRTNIGLSSEEDA